MKLAASASLRATWSSGLQSPLSAADPDAAWYQALFTGVLLGFAAGLGAAAALEWCLERWRRGSRPGEACGDDGVPRSHRRIRDAPIRHGTSLGMDLDRHVNKPRVSLADTPNTRESVMQWLNSSSQDDAAWIFHRLAMGPHAALLRKPPASVAGTLHTPALPPAGAALQAQSAAKLTLSALNQEPPVVMFENFLNIVHEDAGRVELRVIRVGPLDGLTRVAWQTAELSAVSGVNYGAAHSEILFQPGERVKRVSVEIFERELRDPFLEFKASLLQDGVVNGTISQRHHNVRVKIIDESVWPTETLKEEVTNGSPDDLPVMRLLFEYIIFNFQSNSKIRRGTMFVIFIKFCNNMNILLGLMVSVALVDHILAPASKGGEGIEAAKFSLLLVAASILVPHGILHFLNSFSFYAEVFHESSMVLTHTLLSSFLHWEQTSRNSVRPGVTLVALAKDIDQLVKDGYLSIFSLAEAHFELLVAFSFQLISAYTRGRSLDMYVLCALILLPWVTCGLIALREDRTSKSLETEFRAAQRLNTEYSRLTENFQLVQAYNVGSESLDRIVELRPVLGLARNDADGVLTHNSYCFSWVVNLALCGYYLFGGVQVLHGERTLGMFLANVAVFAIIQSAVTKIHKALEAMEKCLPVIRRLTVLLNLPSELKPRTGMAADRTSMTEALLAGLGHHNMGGACIDVLPIVASDIHFEYHQESSVMCTVDIAGSMEVSQGSLACVLGPRGIGKTTLLKILSGELLATGMSGDARVYVPPHLRLIQVHEAGLFFHGTLYENLTIGLPHYRQRRAAHSQSLGGPVVHDSGEETSHRAIAVCNLLDLSPHVVSFIEREERHSWVGQLSASEMFLLCLARALIANPEVLCIHKPTAHIGELASQRVMAVLRDFVNNRGVAVEPSSFHRRRPRTCIVSLNKLTGLDLCDQVFWVDEQGVRQVEKHQVTGDMVQ